jgi:hypothetical protein
MWIEWFEIYNKLKQLIWDYSFLFEFDFNRKQGSNFTISTTIDKQIYQY